LTKLHDEVHALLVLPHVLAIARERLLFLSLIQEVNSCLSLAAGSHAQAVN
jgi:hypothetical protein